MYVHSNMQLHVHIHTLTHYVCWECVEWGAGEGVRWGEGEGEGGRGEGLYDSEHPVRQTQGSSCDLIMPAHSPGHPQPL